MFRNFILPETGEPCPLFCLFQFAQFIVPYPRKRLCGVAGLTVDPDQNKLVLDFCRKLEDETLADWYDQMFYFVRSEMEHYTMMQKMSRDIEEDEDWGPTIFDESEEEELIDDV